MFVAALTASSPKCGNFRICRNALIGQSSMVVGMVHTKPTLRPFWQRQNRRQRLAHTQSPKAACRLLSSAAGLSGGTSQALYATNKMQTGLSFSGTAFPCQHRNNAACSHTRSIRPVALLLVSTRPNLQPLRHSIRPRSRPSASRFVGVHLYHICCNLLATGCSTSISFSESHALHPIL